MEIHAVFRTLSRYDAAAFVFGSFLRELLIFSTQLSVWNGYFELHAMFARKYIKLTCNERTCLMSLYPDISLLKLFNEFGWNFILKGAPTPKVDAQLTVFWDVMKYRLLDKIIQFVML
jgi:hypothetical protein